MKVFRLDPMTCGNAAASEAGMRAMWSRFEERQWSKPEPKSAPTRHAIALEAYLERQRERMGYENQPSLRISPTATKIGLLRKGWLWLKSVFGSQAMQPRSKRM